MVLTRLSAVTAMVEHTREQLSGLFEPHDPEFAHAHYDKLRWRSCSASWKPCFIHSERSKGLVREIISEAGYAHGTHVLRPAEAADLFPVGHLTTGIAYAFPWHRDVWYSAPAQQINWWLPVFAVGTDNSMSFDIQSFDRSRSQQLGRVRLLREQRGPLDDGLPAGRERQSRPAAIGHESADDLVVLPSPGGILLFSGAQLHRSIPNTSRRSRFSVDFRTVDRMDLESGLGAPLLDVQCTGTAIRDFRNVGMSRELDEDVVRALFGTPPPGSMLVFSPAPPGRS